MMTNLVQRVLAAAVGIPLAVLLIWLGGWWFSATMIVVSTVALWEFYHLADSKHASANISVGLVWAVLLQICFAQALDSTGTTGTIWMGLALLAFVAGTLLTLGAEIWRAKENAILNTAVTLSGIAYVTIGFTTILFLRNTASSTGDASLWIDAGGALVLTLFVSVWSSDTLAYFTGLSIGKHKLLERVSPKKTWEGAAGGLAGAVVSFVLMSMWLLPSMAILDAVACGAIVGVFGPIGDLAESWLKRDAVIKDSSHIIPGHGGFLDRFDSMLFAAPLVLIYLTMVNLIRYAV
jgi:phosphatidate cytidylyltransferase